MLSLLKHSYDRLTISDPQAVDPETKFKSVGHGSLIESCHNGVSKMHSTKYSNGATQELGSHTADGSPVLNKERRFCTNRALSLSVEKQHEGKRNNSISPILFETPKLTSKTVTLRRRLLESHLSSGKNVELHKTLQPTAVDSEEWSCTRTCDIFTFSDSLLNSPGDLNFEALSTSTLNNDECGTLCRTKRYLFAQQRTSTIDDLKGKNGLMPECPTSDQSSAFSKLDFSSFSYCEDDSEYSSSGSFVTPSRHEKLKISGGDQFVTPVHFKPNMSTERMLERTPSHDKLDVSTEDSGYNSVSLEKSSDSFSNENSFQELVKNQKKTPMMTDCKRSLRKLERTKRLSTLSERGSQSETEEEHKGIHKGSNYKLKLPNKDEELVFEENNCEDPLLKFENLSRTPALQLIQELCVSKRKRLEDIIKGQSGSEEKPLGVSMPPLCRLIGRKMGLEKVDILKELFNRNLTHVLTLILYCLTVEDICRVWKVSKIWKKIVKQDQALCLKRKQYLDESRNHQVHNQPWAADAETRCNLPDRPALKSVQAQARIMFTPTHSSQQGITPGGCSSASKSSSKREEFLQVAKTLFNDEALKPCPRCQSPARYNPMKKRGLCSREDCAFDFCTQCFCVFHGSRECGSKSAKHFGNKGGTPGSAKSKRNLRRL